MLKKLNLIGYFRNISSSKKSVLSLIGGTTIAQIISLLFSPAITRLFTPEVFGDISVFSSVTSIIGVIICLRYELAIILPKEDNEGISVLKLCYIITGIITFIVFILLVSFREQLFLKMGVLDLEKYWYYIPIILFFNGIIQASNYWLIRKKKYSIISFNKVLPVLVLNVMSVVLGTIGYRNVSSRLFAIFISNIINIVIVLHVILPDVYNSKKNSNEIRYKVVFIRYKKFFVYDVWGALINNISWMIVPILMNIYYSSNMAGQYSIGMRIIQIPASIIGVSIYQVFIKDANEMLINKKLYEYCLKLIKKLFIFTSPMAIILIFWGKELFILIFGKEWEIAGIYSQILAPWSIVWFISSPISGIYTIAQKQNISLITSTLNLITRFFSLYLGKLFKNDQLGILLFSITGVLLNGLSIYLCLNIAKTSDRKNITNLVK